MAVAPSPDQRASAPPVAVRSEPWAHPIGLQAGATLLERVDRLGPMADAHAAETERLRRLPDDIAAGVVETGLPRALVPAVYGGAEHRLQDVLDAIAALAYHDGSTAW